MWFLSEHVIWEILDVWTFLNFFIWFYVSRQHDKSHVSHALSEAVLSKVLSSFDFLTDNLDDEVEGDGEEGIAADDESDIREARGKTGTVVKKKKVRRRS